MSDTGPKLSRILFAAVFGWLSAGTATAVTIATVPVGNPGNLADSTGYGSVGYNYNIDRYEVTAGQYTEFLKAVAKTDTYGLYNASMSNTSFGSGITRSGTSGNYIYSVVSAFVNRPVNYVSYWDACRFANWLHNGQPTGAQGAGTTETGAYTLTPTGIANNTVTRNANWNWAVTSVNEWYKAAYYKGGSTNAGYWLYPTHSNTAPGQDMADASGNNANYSTPPHTYPIDSPYYTTVAGEFQNSASPFGTFDQAGNVWEWNEAVFGSTNRGLRGGSYANDSIYLASSGGFSSTPDFEYDLYGFRVVSVVPEPASALLLLAGLPLFRRRRERIAL